VFEAAVELLRLLSRCGEAAVEGVKAAVELLRLLSRC
jgi:hypothetical protein